MFIQETWTRIEPHETPEGEDDEKRYLVGESDIYEAFTDNIKRLFASLQREHGHCVSKVYIDQKGKSLPIGWVFRKRISLKDKPDVDTYIQETWVTLHDKQPTVTRKCHYHQLTKKK